MTDFFDGRGDIDRSRTGDEGLFDWAALVARREEDLADDFPAWAEALDAFENDPAERERALDADPLMLFRAPRAGGDEDSRSAAMADRDEIESMKSAVAQLRRAKAVEGSSDASAPSWLDLDRIESRFEPLRFGRQGFDKARSSGWGRWLSAAALAAISLSALLLTGTGLTPDAGPGLASLGETSAAIVPLAAAQGASLLPGFDADAAESIEQLPLIEDLDPSMSLVMQLEVDGVSVVFLSPENTEPNPT